ncbi:MAG: FHA domain-containing protein, partial [Pseudomonadota bacterium]|nr:FHA domain-containing protein [Pseudomonadota bacterium]
MNKCSNPDHPHCTLWVMPGDTTCASGHAQRQAPPTSFDLLSARRNARPATSGPAYPLAPTVRAEVPAAGRAGGHAAMHADVRAD